MKIIAYAELPDEAADIRKTVFVDEQGFTEEFDSHDLDAVHIVGFIGEKAVATCRIIRQSEGDYMLGRIAVRKEYRKKGLGSEIIAFGENLIREKQGKNIYIHAQLQAVPFYEKQGYVSTGECDFDEGCEHRMMAKAL